MTKIRKAIIPLDDIRVELIVGFSHNEAEEAKQFYEKITGEKPDDESFEPTLISRHDIVKERKCDTGKQKMKRMWFWGRQTVCDSFEGFIIQH